MSFTITHNGKTQTTPQTPGGKPAPSNSTVQKSALIDGGTFDWRLAYWWVAAMWILFSFTQSLTGAMTLAGILGINAFWRVVLCISVSGAEGVIAAWLTCPQRGLVSKRQEKNLRIGSYMITFFQIVEIGLLYAYTLIGGSWYLWGMGMATVAMLVTAILTVKNVIMSSETRMKALEHSDRRIEEAIADARIKTMEARHRLESKRSIIKIEAEVLRREQFQAMNALNTRESLEGIKQISAGRVKAVIAATSNNMQNYAVKMLNESKPKNAPANPRSLPGSQNGRSSKK